MQRMLVVLDGPLGTHIHNNGDILIRSATVARESYVGTESIFFPADVLRQHGTDAQRISLRLHGRRFGFTVNAAWDRNEDAWMVNAIVEAHDDGSIVTDEKRSEMIALLRDRRSLPGETRLNNQEVDDLIALLSVTSNGNAAPKLSTGDFRCHNCKHVVENVVAAPHRCPVCNFRDFSACAPSRLA